MILCKLTAPIVVKCLNLESKFSHPVVEPPLPTPVTPADNPSGGSSLNSDASDPPAPLDDLPQLPSVYPTTSASPSSEPPPVIAQPPQSPPTLPTSQPSDHPATIATLPSLQFSCPGSPLLQSQARALPWSSGLLTTPTHLSQGFLKTRLVSHNRPDIGKG